MLLIATDSASHLSLATYCIVNAVLPATTSAAAQWAQASLETFIHTPSADQDWADAVMDS